MGTVGPTQGTRWLSVTSTVCTGEPAILTRYTGLYLESVGLHHLRLPRPLPLDLSELPRVFLTPGVGASPPKATDRIACILEEAENAENEVTGYPDSISIGDKPQTGLPGPHLAGSCPCITVYPNC